MGQQLPPPAATPLDMPQHRPAGTAPDAVFSRSQVEEIMRQHAAELRQAAEARLPELSAQFQALQQELASIKADQEQKAAEREQRRLEAASRRDERRKEREAEELSAKQLLQKYRAETEKQVRKLHEELAARDALLAKEREFAAIRDHAARRIAEEADSIDPRFHDYILPGATCIEDVERNIETAKQKTAAIVEEVRQAEIRRQANGKPVSTGSGSYDYPGAAPGAAPQYTAEQIAGMIPGSPEHLAARQQLAGLGRHPAQQHMDPSGFPTDPRMTAFG
jgi:hypothetical protein